MVITYGYHKICKIVGGLLRYAEVSVDVLPYDGSDLVSRHIRLELNPHLEDARRGCYDALEFYELDRPNVIVSILDIVRVEVDTRPSDVYCAAVLATWKALGDENLPELKVGDNNEYFIEWPEVIP